MTDEDPTDPGTPEPTEGDLAQPESPAAATDDRDAEQSQRIDWKRKYLEETKPKLEELNRLKAEHNALKERYEQSPAAPSIEQRDPLGEALQQTREWAEKGDPVARMNLAILEALREQDVRRRTDAVPGDIRKQVESHPRYKIGDVEGARAEIERDHLAQEVDKLRTELARAATGKPNTDVVRTHEREVPASQAKIVTIPRAQWEREQAELMARGNAGDAQAHRERMARQRELRPDKNGRIRLIIKD